MCPMCEKCTTWKLGKTCSYTKVSYMFDNPGTVFFAVFMSFWGRQFTKHDCDKIKVHIHSCNISGVLEKEKC